MGENTKIEWCDHTVNLWWGCTKVHTGCDNCYAENTAHRWGNDIWGNNKTRKEIKKAFPTLKKLNQSAKERGLLETVFIGSMQDIFEKPMPLSSNGQNSGEFHLKTNTLRDILFAKISNGDYENLIFLFLTKRPSNIYKFIPENWKAKAPHNVWFGCSISDQKTADTMLAQILKSTPINANIFLSIEPQVGKVDLSGYLVDSGDFIGGVLRQPISWVIQGGESGNKRRPFKLEWAYMLKKQCEVAGVPYFFKQIDKVKQIPPDLFLREFPKKFQR